MNFKKMESYLRVNLLGPGPRFVKKSIYRAAVSQRLRNTSLHEDKYTFWIIPRSALLRMRTVSDKSCRENQNTYFMFDNFFSENRAVCEIM